jgi:Domain of unknown function (DUF4157)
MVAVPGAEERMSGGRAPAAARAPSPTRAAPRHLPAPPARDAAEREAEQAEAVGRGVLPTGWSFAAVPVSRPSGEPDPQALDAVEGPGRPLDPATRAAMEVHLRADLAGVRLHDDMRSAAATRAAGAEALALGDDVALGGRHDPTSPRSRSLLAHELAHVVQQRSAGSVVTVRRKNGPTVPATTLAGLPEAERERIRVVTTPVTVTDLAGKFATTGTKTTITLPKGVTAEFDASVDLALQHGLGNVAGSLSGTVEFTEAPLPPNSTTTLELDVPKVGKGLYRFTYHAPAAGGGKAAPGKRIIVESLGKATAPAGAKAPAPAKKGAAAAPDTVAEKIKKHGFTHSYKDDALDALRAALAEIPDPQLSLVDGLTFKRAAGPGDVKTTHKLDPDAKGFYDRDTHTVWMFDTAFTPSQTRFTGPGKVAAGSGSRAIVHEIGHAIDTAVLRTATADFDKAEAAVNALAKKYPDPKDPTRYQYEKGSAAEKDVKAVLKAQEDAEKALTTTRSRSGTRMAKPAGKPDFEDVVGSDVKGVKFREAMKKDGGKAVTAYGAKGFHEAFAEAYSLFITSPETLKSLRPNVYDYLDKSLPK